MVTTAVTVIEIDDREDVLRLVDELKSEQAPVILRHDGRDVAVITSLDRARSAGAPLPRKVITDEDRAAFRAAAGSWKDFDAETFLEQNRLSRELGARPPADL